jgi:hypothetical protein
MLLGAAFLFRAFVALAFWNVVAFDEVFQFLEPAHRLVFGQGIVPWEFQVGLRNWLIPLALMPPMALGHVLSANPLVGLGLIRLLMVAASLPSVWCAARWGQSFHGRRGFWVVGLLTAFWPDLWVMAQHTLEEVFGADALVPAIYLVEAARRDPRAPHIGTAGFLLGLSVVLRLQLAPAAAIAGLFLCGADPRRWLRALAAAAIPVAVAGLLDWISWGQPFRSVWLNIYLNVFKHVAADEFGASPPGYFIFILAIDWLWTLPVIAVLAWFGAKKLPVAGLASVAIILTHSLILHKEYRFIYPAIALLVPLAGLGLADWLQAPKPWRRLGLAALLLAGPWCSPWMYFLLTLQSASVTAFDALRAQSPALVAIGPWEESFLPLDILLTGRSRLTDLSVFNIPGARPPDVIVATQGSLTPPPGYTQARCYPGRWIPFHPGPTKGFCIWNRQSPATGTTSEPPWDLGFFPPAAKPFIIPDRLSG